MRGTDTCSNQQSPPWRLPQNDNDHFFFVLVVILAVAITFLYIVTAISSHHRRDMLAMHHHFHTFAAACFKVPVQPHVESPSDLPTLAKRVQSDQNTPMVSDHGHWGE